MPVYVYGCQECRERDEVVHGMTEIVTVLCRKCQKPMKRIPQRFFGHVRIMDAGLRKTYEIHYYNKEKYHANKARREANVAAQRHAEEARKSGRGPAAD